MISWAPEFPAGLLLSMRQTGCTELLLLDTETSVAKKFGEYLAVNFRQEFQIKRLLVTPDPEESISDFVKFILQEISFSDFEQVYFNIAGGTKLHNIALWQLFLQLGLSSKDSDKYEVVFLNLQTFNFHEWQLIDSELNDAQAKCSAKISFMEYLNCHGFSYDYHRASQIFPKWTELDLTPDLQNGIDFEIQIHNFCGAYLQKSISKKTDVIGLSGVKIFHQSSPHRTVAEYDMLFFSKELRIVLFELKSGKKVTLKNVSGQKALSTSWGGRFCTFASIEKLESLNKDFAPLKFRQQLYKSNNINFFTFPCYIDDSMSVENGLTTFFANIFGVK